jgi:hypothetical protein
MPTFQSNRVATTIQSRGDIDITSATAEYTIPAAFATADIVQMVKIPANAQIQEVILSSSAGVGATANLSVGDTTGTANAARYIASTAYTAASLNRLGVHAGHGYRFPAEGTLDVTAVSIATPTAGTVIRLTVIYTLNQ